MTETNDKEAVGRLYALVDENGNIPFIVTKDEHDQTVETVCVFRDREQADMVRKDNSGKKKLEIDDGLVLIDRSILGELVEIRDIAARLQREVKQLTAMSN